MQDSISKYPKQKSLFKPILCAIIDALFIGLFVYFYFGVEDQVNCKVSLNSNIPLSTNEKDFTDVTFNFDFVLIFLIISGILDLSYELVSIASILGS